MKKPTFHLIADTQDINVCKFDGTRAETTPISIEAGGVGKAIGDVLSRMGHRGQPLVLCLSSSRCFAVALKPEDISARDYRTLCFAMEGSLPLDAENLVADFEYSGQGVFGVAADLESLEKLLADLRSNGIQVRSIVPLTLLALDQYLADERERHPVVLCQSGDRLEIIRLQNNTIQRWQTCDLEVQSVRRTLLIDLLDGSESVAISCLGIEESFSSEIVTDTNLVFSNHPEWDLIVAAMRRADAVAAGTVRPRLDLKRAELTAGSVGPLWNYVQMVLIAGVLLLIALNVGFWIRGSQYLSAANDQKAIQSSIFKKVLPSQTVPVGVGSRLESELQGRQEQLGEELDLTQAKTLLNTLHELLAALPGDMRYQIEFLAVEPTFVRVQGVIKSTDDLEKLMMAFRKHGFRVKPPTTNNTSDGFVGFTLIVDWDISGEAT